VAFRPLGGALLPEVDDKQRRSYVAIGVNVADGPLVVVDAHLEGGSAEQIDALLDAWGGAVPAAVAGDMNMKLTDEAEVSLFTDAGLTDVESATGDPCRTTSAEPTSTCDRPSWIFVTEGIEIDSFRIGPPSASDHLPLYLTLTIGPG
jgi:endonuclease/exonuclease/phosphatase family metal-dependent hydrolase